MSRRLKRVTREYFSNLDDKKSVRILNSLFGEEEKGWHKIDIDIESGKDLVVETHLGAIVRGETSDDLYTVNRALLLPGLITDELNRGHSKVVNSVMHIFDKDITMQNGKRAKLGMSTNPESDTNSR